MSGFEFEAGTSTGSPSRSTAAMVFSAVSVANCW